MNISRHSLLFNRCLPHKVIAVPLSLYGRTISTYTVGLAAEASFKNGIDEDKAREQRLLYA